MCQYHLTTLPVKCTLTGALIRITTSWAADRKEHLREDRWKSRGQTRHFFGRKKATIFHYAEALSTKTRTFGHFCNLRSPERRWTSCSSKTLTYTFALWVVKLLCIQFSYQILKISSVAHYWFVPKKQHFPNPKLRSHKNLRIYISYFFLTFFLSNPLKKRWNYPIEQRHVESKYFIKQFKLASTLN